jgi:putative ABC transport system permease protein
MKSFLVIPLRNVLRNRRRTAITLMVIVFGAMALMLSGGFFDNSYEGLRERTIRNGLGHVQVVTEPFLKEGEERPLANGLQDYRALQARLEAFPHVVGTTGEVSFVGLISNGEKSEAFLGRGVEPAREQQIGFTTNIKEGQALSLTDPTEEGAQYEALLGMGLASTLKVKVGDVLTLLSTTTEGSLNGIDVKVTGLFTTGVKEFDDRAVKVKLSTAQVLVGSDRVTRIIVKLDETRHTDGVVAAINDSGLDAGGSRLRARSWSEVATFYHQVVRMYDAIFLVLGVIIVVLVVLSSSNTMMMAVLERVQEVGTLMAIGARRWQVLGIFIVEGFLVGSLGAVLGLLLSFAAIKGINAANILLPPPPTFSSGIPLKINFVPRLCLSVFALVTLTQTVSALLPSIKAARLKIVDALRHI